MLLEHVKGLGGTVTLEEIEEQNKIKQKKIMDDIVAEAKQQAKAIIESAENNAADMIKKSEEEILKKIEEIEILKQQTIEEATKQGFQKGYEDGINQAKQEIIDNIWGIDVLTESSFKIKKEIIDSAEKDIIELSTAIAEKIVKRKLQLKPSMMQKIIKSSIEQLKDKEEVKIIANPALVNNLYDFSEEIKETVKGLKTIKVIEDRTIPRNGVIVESLDSRIDGRVETQLAEIVKNIMREFSQKTLTEGIPKEIDVKIDDNARKIKKNKKEKDE